MTAPTATRSAIPAGIWVLGFVSMLMDISSEMIHALLPVYMVTILGTSALTVGIIEGIAEATASITKVFSGALSDWLGKRKFLAALGYGLAAFTKPIFPLAPTVGGLVAARFVDRIGKGIRGAPRDALVADIAPAHLRGASFGLRQSLGTDKGPKHGLFPYAMPHRPIAAAASNEPAGGYLPQTQSPRRVAFEILSLFNIYKFRRVNRYRPLMRIRTCQDNSWWEFRVT
ncbi:MFS transporter [Aminobacter aminovorans]|uniref:MFS transporter, sialate:H+ symporter (SHS) family n=1 Tax=Aminobacter aminovorans TaxID=83263 RepID=A0A380WL38_AMIAI|nr:MFS transporter [Aminobacter aminovorans]SUU89022.1 MFS transporter, sialate:H+ symporter (SHS) family [Aminobacter aminovorans]